MAVAAFNSDYNKSQQQLEKREKDKANGWGASTGTSNVKSMSGAQIDSFKNSKFMKQTQQIDELVKDSLAKRDKSLMQLDRTFLPQDSDWDAPKSYKFDKFTNYYGTLGLQDMATQEEIKQAYRRLSLVYHPDKTAGMPQEQKDKYAGIFIELKNAYITLMDNPTRRQYDAERTREYIMCEVSGGKMKDRKQFYGYEVRAEKMKEVEEKTKGPGKTVEIPIQCRLEKFVNGGAKCFRRTRKVQIRGEWTTKEKEHHMLVPPGAAEPLEVRFFQKGDEQEDVMPDTLLFKITSRPHADVERVGDCDLAVKSPASLSSNLANEPFLSTQASSVQGRHVLLWGRNPFFHNAGTGKYELKVTILGGGLGKAGSLLIKGQPGKDSIVQRGRLWEVVGGADKGGILVRSGPDPSAPKENDRLSTGAMVKALQIDGDRLNYERVSGTGPSVGWVATRLPGKDLVVEGDLVWEVAECSDGAGVAVLREASASSVKLPEYLAKGSLLKQRELKGGFLRYELVKGSGPPSGWVSTGGQDASAGPRISKPPTQVDPSAPAAIQKRLRRQLMREETTDPVCEVELAPFGQPVDIFTKPACSITFYSNLQQAATAKPGCVKPRAMFAIVVTSPKCAKKKFEKQWGVLKSQLVPLLEMTGFKLLTAARSLLPKSLANAPAFPDSSPEEGAAADGTLTPELCERLGGKAYACGDYWLAAQIYSKGAADFAEREDMVGKMLSYRAGCLAKVEDYDGCLEDAKRATELLPAWGQPWEHVGFACQNGAGNLTDAFEAYSKAVELGASNENVEMLHTLAARLGDPSLIAVLRDREKGDAALKGREFGLAVAKYTVALAQMPPPTDNNKKDVALTTASLYASRSSAFAQLRNWPAAVADAEGAVRHQPDSPQVHQRLGVALLGSGFAERAYRSLAWAVKLAEDNDEPYPAAVRAKTSCLVELARGVSQKAVARHKSRFFMDAHRPRGTFRIFACSDIHFDQKVNEEWVMSIDGSKFQDDILVIAGDAADTMVPIKKALSALKGKFRRVFFTLGCHEYWIPPNEKNVYPDSIAKMTDIMEFCDQIGVDIGPAAVAHDVFVVPLMSWYNAEFDEKEPFPEPNVQFDPLAKWPMDKDHQVWKYMLSMNEPSLQLPYHGTVITFSQAVPRQNLPFWNLGAQVKFIGCSDIDKQARSINSKLHVYGRTHRRCAKDVEGVMYVNMPLGKWDERMEEVPPIELIFDGKDICAKEWSINDGPFTA
mmetsp:Transcript_54766/g.154154  ORF Transcript_54766/g.154154 Transcript_54766/m.154154 type:complete len:1237 (-) Transcript_54766:65-3775(-)